MSVKFVIIAMIGGALLSHSCTRHGNRLSPYGWEATGLASDSVVTLLNDAVFSYADADTIQSLADNYCRLSATDYPSADYNHRRLYWQGTAAFMSGDYERGDSLRCAALAACDSTAFPHDYRIYRMVTEQPSDFTDNTARYHRYLEDYHFFLAEGDLSYAATRGAMLANLLRDVGMPDQGLRYAVVSDSLLTVAGLNELRNAYRSNLASALFAMRDTAGAVNALQKVLDTSVDPTVDAIVRYNIYQMNGDTAMLNEVWESIADMEWLDKFKALVRADMVKAGTITGPSDYQLLADALDTYDYLPEEQVQIAEALCIITSQGNDSAQIKDATEQYMAAVENARRQRNESELTALTTRQQILKTETELRDRQSRTKVLMWLIIACSVFAISLTAILIIRRNNRIKQLQMLLVAEAAREKNVVRVERDSVKNESDFTALFMNRYPRVGKTGRRLALYIWLGLDTSEIALKLNIRKESVIQSRWRLRQQMSLRPDEDLDYIIGTLH